MLTPRARLRHWYRKFQEGDAFLALRIALGYLLLGAVWIAASDRMLGSLVADPGWFARLQTVKG